MLKKKTINKHGASEEAIKLLTHYQTSGIGSGKLSEVT